MTRLPAVLLSCIAVAQLGLGGEPVSAQKISDIFAGLKSAHPPGAAVLVIEGLELAHRPARQVHAGAGNQRPLIHGPPALADPARIEVVKTEIHPEYVEAHVRCTCGNEFTTRSTKPELHVEICSNCHPFYTGRQKLVDTGGRVERFKRRAAKRRPS